MAALVLLSGAAVAAQPEITALEPLDFGTLAVLSNATPATIVLSPQGNTAYGGAFVFIAPATPGRYRLTGYPPYTTMTVSLSNPNLARNGSGPGEQLAVSAPVTRPQTLRTDQNGTVEFSLGASLSTSGNGPLYEDAPYLGRPTLTMHFEVDGVMMQSHQELDVSIALRSSLALTELDSVNFGRIAVFSSTTDQASLRLQPDGQVVISNPGAARIIRFGGEVPGRFRISAGAAFAPVTVTLPSETIYLTHHSQSPTVARLLVSDFSIQPTPANLKLDANGAVEFRLGATLRTEQGTRQYQDGEYSGTFPLTVEY